MGFLRRQAVTAALVGNAIRPLPGFQTQVPAFFASWLIGELAPHVLTATVADAAAHATPSRRDRRALALAALNVAGLFYLVTLARRVQQQAEESLAEGLGADYGEQLDQQPTPADLATPWRSLVNPFRNRADGVRVERNIAYNSHGKRGHLDLYLPAEGDVEDAPVLLQVHGGAWTVGTKDQQGLPLMRHLAAKGWICVAINYRLAPRDRWPAQIVDVKEAIAWIREHIASYGGDPDYIAITGGSAGGHLCSLAALTPNDPAWQPGFEDADTTVQACVPHYGVYDLAGATNRTAALMRDRFLARWVFPARFDDDPETYEQASPLNRVTADAPDFFVLHGVNDSLVPVAQARELVARLRETSRSTVVYAELPGTQHAFDVFPSIRSAHVVRAIDRYLHWHWNSWRKARVPAGG